MTSQKLAGVVKSHWPLAVIAIAVAVLAFAAGALTSNRGAADEPTPAAAVEPTPWPDDVPQELPLDFHPSEVRFTRPTDASREAARNCPTGRIGSSAGSDVWHCVDIRGRRLSESEIQALRLEQERDARQRAAGASDAPVMGELIKLNNGKSLQLPNDVYIKDIRRFMSDPDRANPIYVLSNGVSTVDIDGHGRLHPGASRRILDQFEFLREFQSDFPVTIQLAGRDVELPDTVFVRFKALDETDVDGPSPKGTAYPVYILGKGGLPLPDSIMIDANGKLIPGLPEDLLGEFEFLREFQNE